MGLAERLAVVARFRRLLADRAEAFAGAAARPQASAGDILVCEVMPLLAACRFLERRAARILAATRPAGRPIWLMGTRLAVRRVPLGRVLVIGPSNYPLLLPGVQIMQALTAGNTVLVKPAPGCAAPMRALHDAMMEAGLAPTALIVLGEDTASAQAVIRSGVDHVVLTGSAETGRAVLAELAPHLVPATMELSGRDAMIVLDGADLDLAARAAAFGLSLNGGRTCIAPRRIIVVAAIAEAFQARLQPLLEAAAPIDVPAGLHPHVAAIAGTAVLSAGRMRPCVIPASVGDAWVDHDLFAPIAALLVVADEAAAVELANTGPYALGATVFGPHRVAQRVVGGLRAGCVLVNDMIVPTAHPALPFGGAGTSGFGVTRGAEGLLAMTRAQAVVERRRPSTRHLTTLSPRSAKLIAPMLRLAYGTGRWRAGAAALRALGHIGRRATPRDPAPSPPEMESRRPS